MFDSHWPATPTPFEPLIGAADLATWLDVSVHTVKKWITRGPEAGLVPRMIHVNGLTKFRPEDVRAWIDSKADGS